MIEIISTNGKQALELCSFTSQNLFVLFSITDSGTLTLTNGTLPQGLTFNETIISGTPTSLNSYHSVKDYVVNSISSLPDSTIPFKDIPDLTVQKIKNSATQMDVGGNLYTLKGLKGYLKDNPSGGTLNRFIVEFSFQSNVLNELGELPLPIKYEGYVQVNPNYSPRGFVTDYGTANPILKNDNMEILTPQEYINWRLSQNQNWFLQGCS